MRVLITGGAGFLGSALANHLARAGHHVRVLDDLSCGDTSHLHAQVYFERGDYQGPLTTMGSFVQCRVRLSC